MRTGKGLLLDFDMSPALEALGRRWNDRVTYIAGDVEDRLGLSAVLVRPDGIVAWVGEDIPDHPSAVEAVSRWFGEA